MNINQYLKKGYELSPIYKELDLEEYKKVKKIELDELDLKELLLNKRYKIKDLFYDKDKVIVIKYKSRYKITIEDMSLLIKEFIKNEIIDEDDIGALNFLFNLKYKNKYIYSPNLNDFNKNIHKDYLYDDNNHLVLFLIAKLLNDTNHDDPLEELCKLERFISDILNNRDLNKHERKYSNETLGFILEGIDVLNDSDSSLDPKILKFYKENLIKLASINDPVALRSLGYNYYEGLYDFPLDYSKSLYYLTKYFELTEDMDVTRPIGYIYYYGRNNNGIPQKEKAFQFFVLGHLAGYFESTYKLADCYLHGYGTIKSNKTAYELVNSLYNKTYNHFLNGHHSKYADIALRMGNFYKNAIYVSKDLELAKSYYLKARCAIKERLKEINEYPGDRSVALGIYTSLNELNEDNERIIKYGGYLVKSFKEYYNAEDYLIKFDFVKGFIHIYISSKENDYLLNVIPSLNFSERSKVIEYLIKIENYEVLEFINLVNKYPLEALKLTDNELIVILNKNDEEVRAAVTFNELINIPQTLDSLHKKYIVVSVEFYEGSKLYDYLTFNKNIKINDIVKVRSREEIKKVKVKEIKYLYEDELALPLEKMSKIL